MSPIKAFNVEEESFRNNDIVIDAERGTKSIVIDESNESSKFQNIPAGWLQERLVSNEESSGQKMTSLDFRI